MIYQNDTKIPEAVSTFFNYLEKNCKTFEKKGLKVSDLTSAFNSEEVSANVLNYKPILGKNFKDEITIIFGQAKSQYSWGSTKNKNFLQALQQAINVAEKLYASAISDQVYARNNTIDTSTSKDRLQLNRTASQIIKDIKRAMLNSISSNETITSVESFLTSSSASNMNIAGNIQARDILNEMPKKLAAINEKKLNKSIKDLLTIAFKEAIEETLELEIKVDDTKDKNKINFLTQNYPLFVENFLNIFERITIDIKGPEDLYMQMCEYEAVNDLISGKLHRLDPVIRDAGCQWRVPFVIDLYKAVTKKFPEKESLSIISLYDKSLIKHNLKNTMHIMLDIDNFLRKSDIIYRKLGDIPTAINFTEYDNNQLYNLSNNFKSLKDPAETLIEAINSNNLKNVYLGNNATATGSITYASCQKEFSKDEHKLFTDEIKKHNKKAKVNRSRKPYFYWDIEARKADDSQVPDVIWTGPDYYAYVRFADESNNHMDNINKIPFNLKIFNPPKEYLDFFNEVKKYINSLTFEDMVVFGEKPKQTEKQGTGNTSIWETMLNKRAHYAEENFNPVFLYNTSTMRYLTLCKAFTARQIRRMDSFGMSGVPSSLNAPCFDDNDMSAGQVELSYYSRCYLINAFERMLKDPNNAQFINQDLKTNDKYEYKSNDEKPTAAWSMAQHLVEALKRANWYYKCGKHHGHTAAYYENKRLLYMYCFLRDIPIIVDLKRLICKPTSTNKDKKLYTIVAQSTGEVQCFEEATYTLMGQEIYYFKPDKELYRFVHTNKFDQKLYGITIESHSMLNTEHISFLEQQNSKLLISTEFKNFDNFFKNEMDIVDQYLCATCTHPAANRAFRPNEVNLYAKNKDRKIVKNYVSLNDWTSKDCSPGDSDVDMFLTIVADNNLNKCLKEHKNYKLVQRDWLPLFGNSYENDNWNICAERILVANVAKEQHWTNHAYKHPVVDDLVQARSTSSYIVSSTHIYGNNYEANSVKAKKLSIRTKDNLLLCNIPQGRLIELKDCEPLIY